MIPALGIADITKLRGWGKQEGIPSGNSTVFLGRRRGNKYWQVGLPCAAYILYTVPYALTILF